MTEKEVQAFIEEIIKSDDDIKETEIQPESKVLPLIALRGKVLFPKTLLNFDVGRPMSVAAVEQAVKQGSEIFITSQRSAFVESPKFDDMCKVGVVARIKQVVKMQNADMVKLGVKALYRARVQEVVSEKGYFTVSVTPAPYIEPSDATETEAFLRVAKKVFMEYASGDKRIGKELLATLNAFTDPNEFIDNALSVVNLKEADVQEILETDDTLTRLESFKTLFDREIEIAKIERKISAKVRGSIDKSQKEFYLREQIKAIHSELGEDPEEGQELIEQIKAKGLPKDVEEKALKEISRLDKINPSSPDYSIILNYLDWIKDLPFNQSTVDTENLKQAKEILDKDHFGLEKVKQRIVEYLAVLQLTKQIKGPILCFVGPPGVGKTSVATSIARALNRKFVRMSLGGVKDEAEIRGHRKTYIGAMPGRIIYGMKEAKTINPVFLLDEIDKLSQDLRGDPASALLEVLDPEQNTTFRDRYLELEYDL